MKTALLFLMISYYQTKNATFICFFTRGRHKNIGTYYFSESYFHLPKNNIRKTSNKNILFEQTVRDIILLNHDIARLDMKLEERKQLCRKPWEIAYDCLQINSFAK